MNPYILLFIGWEGGKIYELCVDRFPVTRRSMAASFAGNSFARTKSRKHTYMYKDDCPFFSTAIKK